VINQELTFWSEELLKYNIKKTF